MCVGSITSGSGWPWGWDSANVKEISYFFMILPNPLLPPRTLHASFPTRSPTTTDCSPTHSYFSPNPSTTHREGPWWRASRARRRTCRRRRTASRPSSWQVRACRLNRSIDACIHVCVHPMPERGLSPSPPLPIDPPTTPPPHRLLLRHLPPLLAGPPQGPPAPAECAHAGLRHGVPRLLGRSGGACASLTAAWG